MTTRSKYPRFRVGHYYSMDLKNYTMYGEYTGLIYFKVLEKYYNGSCKVLLPGMVRIWLTFTEAVPREVIQSVVHVPRLLGMIKVGE